MKTVDLYRKPLKIIEDTDAFVEMTENEMAFICGLVKKHTPHKIVEVGVAAGNTTCVLLECIKQLEIDTKLFSVDVRETYYRDETKITGYVVEEKFEKNDRKNHILYRGKLLPEVIEKIGHGIDMIILDTMHRIPGEILDFILCLPYLSKNSIIVLHDICFNQIRDIKKSDIREIICTNALFSAAVGDKYLNEDTDNLGGASNIGAIQVDADTMKYIENVFLVMLLNWSYMPGESELNLYGEIYQKHYSQQQCKIFREAVELNRNFLQNH